MPPPALPQQKTASAVADEIALRLAIEQIHGLCEGPLPPAITDGEALAPYIGIVEDLWDGYAQGSHAAVRQRWAEMRAELLTIAPKLLKAVERSLRLQSRDARREEEDKRELLGIATATSPLLWVGSAAEHALVLEAGYTSCVAVPEIPPLRANYRKALAFLQPYEEQLLSIKQHTFLLPNTAEGRALQAEVIRRLGVERCWTIAWPSECATVADILDDGADLLAECLTHANPVPIEGVRYFRDLRQTLYDWYHHGTPQGFKVGWPSLDPIYRVMPGELTIITGVPSTGKSSFLCAMLVKLAETYDWSFALYSAEMPESYLLRLLLRQHIGMPFEEGPSARMLWSQAEQGIEWVDRHFSYLSPKNKLPTVAHILDLADKQVFRGITGLVIDPWNRVSHQRPPGMSETDYIGQSLAQIARFAEDSKVATWVVAHPTKVFKDGGQYPIITPNLISGSSNWWNMSSNILSLWRDHSNPGNHDMDIHTHKIRFEHSGRMGAVAKLRYHSPTGRFLEI